MDVIRLTGIRSYGYTGALPEEQVLGQWFEVDVSVWLDLSLPGQSDRLKDTLDYCAIVETVQHIIKTAKFALLERLADAIINAIFDATTTQKIRIDQVKVCLTKLAAPIPDFMGNVTIELTRKH
jgi:dihydroneopterin aldolase